jgi:hypothetical protein
MLCHPSVVAGFTTEENALVVDVLVFDPFVVSVLSQWLLGLLLLDAAVAANCVLWY